MEALYRLIAEKIKRAGYPGVIDVAELYDNICDEMEEKENGTYLLMIKGEGNMHFECRVDIMDEEFDLPYIDIHVGDKMYHVDLDAE